VRVFDANTGQQRHLIEAHSSGIKKVAVSPTSGDILSAAYDQKIIIWDSKTFEQKVALDRCPSTWERSLTFSPDGRQVLGGTFDGTVLEWDAADGRLLREIGLDAEQPGNPCFNEVAVGREGEIATVSDDGFVRLGRLTSDEGRWLAKVEPRTGRVLMNAVTMSDEYGLVVGGAHDHTVRIFRRVGDELTDEIDVRLGQGPINSLRIAQHPGYQSQIFAACYSSRIVRISPEGKILGMIEVHEGAVKSLRLHPREAIGVSCGALVPSSPAAREKMASAKPNHEVEPPQVMW